MPSVQEICNILAPTMSLQEICEVEATIESLGQNPASPAYDDVIEAIEDMGYQTGQDSFIPDDVFTDDMD